MTSIISLHQLEQVFALPPLSCNIAAGFPEAIGIRDDLQSFRLCIYSGEASIFCSSPSSRSESQIFHGSVPRFPDRTPTVLACIHCVVPDCSLHPSTRQALSGNHFATHQYPQQSCTPFVANTWHCFQLVPSASVLRPVLVQQRCHVLLLCRRTPWQSKTCADQLEDTLDFQPISTNLSRKLSRRSRQFDQQFESQCAYPMRHPRCSAPSESSSHEEIP